MGLSGQHTSRTITPIARRLDWPRSNAGNSSLPTRCGCRCGTLQPKSNSAARIVREGLSPCSRPQEEGRSGEADRHRNADEAPRASAEAGEENCRGGEQRCPRQPAHERLFRQHGASRRPIQQHCPGDGGLPGPDQTRAAHPKISVVPRGRPPRNHQRRPPGVSGREAPPR